MSSIEWTGDTWNPLTSCNKVSPGCANCYAELMSKRLKAMGQAKYANATNGGGKWSGAVEFWPDTLAIPAKKKKPTTWFVNSMSDLFHPKVEDAWLEQIWRVMADNPRHTFQILTKRAQLMDIRARKMSRTFGVLPNVWLGVSVENEKYFLERVAYLLNTPAAVHFISAEPLLAGLDLLKLLDVDSHTATRLAQLNPRQISFPAELLDLIIVGGESGFKARRFDIEWAGKIVEDCQELGISVFVKQMGAKPHYDGDPVKGLGRKGNDPSLWPAGLNIRQMPIRVAV
ncbi:MAG: DUF5131 family protein [Gammaproteobacteria bacterium]